MRISILAVALIASMSGPSQAQTALTPEQEQAATELAARLGAAMSNPDQILGAGLDGESPAAVGASLAGRISQRQREVFELAWPMLVGGAQHGLCKANWQTGALVAELDLYGNTGAGRIDHVASGSPAAMAGLEAGDQIVRVNGRTVRNNKETVKRVDTASEDSAPVLLQVRRDGQLLDLAVQPVQACALKVALMDATGTSLATGETGMVQIDARAWSEAKDDFERQIVIAHELGHHAEGHVATRSRLAKGGRLLDTMAGYVGLPTYGAAGALGALATKGGDETEADANSLRFLATVGITQEEAVRFWEQINEGQGHVFTTYSAQHPISDKRVANLRESASKMDPKFVALSQQVRDSKAPASAPDEQVTTKNSNDAP